MEFHAPSGVTAAVAPVARNRRERVLTRHILRGRLGGMPLTDRQVRALADQAGPGRDHLIAAIAARQDGTIATRQLAAVGVPQPAVSRRVAAGRLHPMLTGVHAVGHPEVGRRGWWQAALLAAGPTATLSHRAAAELWGIADPRPGPIDVTVPGITGRRRRGVRCHGGQLDRRDVEHRAGLPVTTVARTLLDLAEQVTVPELVRTLDRAEAARLHRPAPVADVLARANGRRGSGRLRQALLIARPQDVLTRSELERRALRTVRRHGLPQPEVNVVLCTYEVDLLWRERRLAVELDGRGSHGDGVAFERDRRRDATLAVAGWQVLRFTWRQVVNEPAWVAGTLRHVLARGA